MSGALLYGLVGYPLGHSFSLKFFTEKGIREHIDLSYGNFPLKNIGELPEMLAANPDLKGFNVTIPYKEQIIPYLDRLDPVAEAIGAVNCVAVEEDGTLTGYNTDAPAFRDEVIELTGNQRPAALLLGSGGASKAAAYALRELGMEYLMVSRTPGEGRITYEDLSPEIVRTHKLIVNATPLGMTPDASGYPPLPYNCMTPGHLLFDLVYNPPQTEFMRRGALHGAKTINGYGMLVRQAELSWEIWQHRR